MARIGATCTGAILAIAALTMSMGGQATLAAVGADVRVYAPLSGEFDVTPTDLLLTGFDLLAGDPGASARLSLRNQTGSPLEVAVVFTPSTPDLDGDIVIRLRDDHRTVLTTRLRSEDPAASRSIAFAPGETRVLDVDASVAPDAAAYQGAAVEVATRLIVSIPDGP